MMDTDKDGKLTNTEMKNGLRSLTGTTELDEIANAELDQLFDRLKDSDDTIDISGESIIIGTTLILENSLRATLFGMSKSLTFEEKMYNFYIAGSQVTDRFSVPCCKNGEDCTGLRNCTGASKADLKLLG